ncbi:unnamed protein product [Nippostrongylus brasiliensis]|uniref:Uncharacterized protein n=1 Tax=Nippostrongylus brasiliensis TaxID=27835 RepID=A0A0N4XFJ0_NIPBR|nr:unnamed protein product [Nippostrongylus brasiliensis]
MQKVKAAARPAEEPAHTTEGMISVNGVISGFWWPRRRRNMANTCRVKEEVNGRAERGGAQFESPPSPYPLK